MAVNQVDLTSVARIRNAALELFAEKGPRATVREVARKAGVSAGLVQHHFPTKAALRDAVNAHVVAIASDFFAVDPGEGPPVVVQRRLGDRVTAFVRENPSALRYVARAVADDDEGALEIFDAFVGIAKDQWEQLADASLLNPEADLTWIPLHVVILNLATVLMSSAISRHLPEPFFSPKQLERWNSASNALFEHGVYRASGATTESP